MTHTADPYWGLPDPEIKPEFYADTTTKRFIAWWIDTALIVLLCVLILPFTAFTALFFFPVFYFVVGFVYRVLTISAWSGTLGMALMSVEFRTHDGRKLPPGLALLHTLGYTISASMVLVQLVSIALMVGTPRGQGLSDLVLGTVAINRAAKM